ncbi:7393_t:CDS:2, partial [Scutellospora calospora]
YNFTSLWNDAMLNDMDVVQTLLEFHNQKNEKEFEEMERMISDEQKRIVDIVMNKRKSLFFTGSGGCGKTYTLNYLIRKLYKEFGKDKIGVSSSTALSAMNIKDGMTIHKLFSIGIMDKPFKEIIDNIRENDFIYDRILKLEILIIDEISMINEKTFEFVDRVAREI